MNSLGKTIDGKLMYPTMYGDEGWYNYTPAKYTYNALELYYLSMKAEDRRRLPTSGWIAYLDGKNPGYPVQALRADLTRIRERAAAMRLDTTTPDTRLADDPMKYNPASVESLIELMLGGVHPRHNGAPIHCRVRYFDPAKRRAGIPEGVAALVQRLSTDELTLTLVNTDQLHERDVILQAGGYGEHQFASATTAGKTVPVDARDLTVRLAPGAGAQLVLTMKRYANTPTLRFPWDIVRP